MGPFIVADCWLDAENVILAACSMGLRSCVIGAAVPALNTPNVKADRGIPEQLTAIGPTIVGIPGAETSPAACKQPGILFWK